MKTIDSTTDNADNRDNPPEASRRVVDDTDTDNDWEQFLEIYRELAKTLTYDLEYTQKCKKKEIFVDKLSFYQLKQKETERTEKEKRGVCTTFSMRISKELDSLGIENYLVFHLYIGGVHCVNLYRYNGEFFVADLTADMVDYNHYKEWSKFYKTWNKLFKKRDKEIPCDRYVKMPAKKYFIKHPIALVLEPIKDDGRRPAEMSMVSWYKFFRKADCFSDAAKRNETESDDGRR